MLHFKAQGDRVISLSQREGTDINPYLKSQGIEAYSYLVKRPGGLFFFIRHIIYFIKFCKKQKVDYVFSHLDPANFVASIAQYFIRSKVFLNRHHIDEAALYNFHSSVTYRITNFLAKRIIVVSKRAMQYMIEIEKVPARKLYHLNLAYDFSLFKMPDRKIVDEIRNQFGGGLLLLTACRLTKYKRPRLAVELVSKLHSMGVPAKLLILGSGEMDKELGKDILDRDLKDSVFLLGHLSNVLDYMEASNFVIHPSILESSCVVIKEAGLIRKPVIACESIGDFDDYIIDGSNGFLVDKDNFVDEAAEKIYNNYENHQLLAEMGNRLHEEVRSRFDVGSVSSQLKLIMKS